MPLLAEGPKNISGPDVPLLGDGEVGSRNMSVNKPYPATVSVFYKFLSTLVPFNHFVLSYYTLLWTRYEIEKRTHCWICLRRPLIFVML